MRGEVARALEVHPSDLYRWRREIDREQHALPGTEAGWSKAGSRNWSAKSGGRRWRSIF